MKKKALAQGSHVNFVKFSRIPFSQNTSGQLRTVDRKVQLHPPVADFQNIVTNDLTKSR